MRLVRVRVDRAQSCGGLLDGVDLVLPAHRSGIVAPICFVGRNGAGKSQLLQLIAEIFQAAWHQTRPKEERETSNAESLFELQYERSGEPNLIRLRRVRTGRRIGLIEMAKRDEEGEWIDVPSDAPEYANLLPPLIVGYTSGDNQTLSLPFFISRSGYAADVRDAAWPNARERFGPGTDVLENRLLMIDYATHLEVLVANLLLNGPEKRRAMLTHACLDDLASFRCIIQLNHLGKSAPPGAPPHRKGIQLTDELEQTIDTLTRCATCWSYDPDREIYTFDYLVDDQLRRAFATYYTDAQHLYRALHKFSLLNDIAIPKPSRDRLRREIETRRFAARLPEPQDENKVFRFEQIGLSRTVDGRSEILDYVSLSDGEHQFAQILGIFLMIEDDGVVFLLDEPESHFNPVWRQRFTKLLSDLPGVRGSQDVLMTTHAPFVPCDLPREQVVIFSKDGGTLTLSPPKIETFGASFDRILEACFDVDPPISKVAQDKLNELMLSDSELEISQGLENFGPSVERSFLADRLRKMRQNRSG